MNRKVALVIAVAFALVSGFVLLGVQPAAHGQKPDKAQQWEYKILNASDGEFAQAKVDADFNKLAADGWEFVQVLVSRASPQPLPKGELVIPPPLNATTCILFKRAKK